MASQDPQLSTALQYVNNIVSEVLHSISCIWRQSLAIACYNNLQNEHNIILSGNDPASTIAPWQLTSNIPLLPPIWQDARFHQTHATTWFMGSATGSAWWTQAPPNSTDRTTSTTAHTTTAGKSGRKSVAASPSPVLLQGTVRKMGAVHRVWRTRVLALRWADGGPMVEYFHSLSDVPARPKGTVPCAGHRVQVTAIQSNTEWGYELQLQPVSDFDDTTGAGRVWRFRLATSQSARAWSDALHWCTQFSGSMSSDKALVMLALQDAARRALPVLTRGAVLTQELPATPAAALASLAWTVCRARARGAAEAVDADVLYTLRAQLLPALQAKVTSHCRQFVPQLQQYAQAYSAQALRHGAAIARVRAQQIRLAREVAPLQAVVRQVHQQLAPAVLLAFAPCIIRMASHACIAWARLATCCMSARVPSGPPIGMGIQVDAPPYRLLGPRDSHGACPDAAGAWLRLVAHHLHWPRGVLAGVFSHVQHVTRGLPAQRWSRHTTEWVPYTPEAWQEYVNIIGTERTVLNSVRAAYGTGAVAGESGASEQWPPDPLRVLQCLRGVAPARMEHMLCDSIVSCLHAATIRLARAAEAHASEGQASATAPAQDVAQVFRAHLQRTVQDVIAWTEYALRSSIALVTHAHARQAAVQQPPVRLMLSTSAIEHNAPPVLSRDQLRELRQGSERGPRWSMASAPDSAPDRAASPPASEDGSGAGEERGEPLPSQVQQAFCDTDWDVDVLLYEAAVSAMREVIGPIMEDVSARLAKLSRTLQLSELASRPVTPQLDEDEPPPRARTGTLSAKQMRRLSRRPGPPIPLIPQHASSGRSGSASPTSSHPSDSEC